MIAIKLLKALLSILVICLILLFFSKYRNSSNIYEDFVQHKPVSPRLVTHIPGARIIMIGDSWTGLCPEDVFGEPYDKIAYCGESLSTITNVVSNQPDQHYDTVYIMSGIANYLSLLDQGVSKDEAFKYTTEEILELTTLAKKKFSPEKLIVCDLPLMLEWCSNPENQYQSQSQPKEFCRWHLKPEAYQPFLSEASDSDTDIF